jgi:hypothetical protein
VICHWCLNPTSARIEASLILVTFQGGTLTHLGYARCGPAGGVSCSFDPTGDGQLHWVYAVANGVLKKGDTLAGGAPELGDQYRIRMDVGPCGCYTFRVKNLTDGDTGYTSWTQASAVSSAGQVWWGTEIHFSTSAMGTKAGSPDLFMEDLEYLPTGGVWTRVDNESFYPVDNYSAPNGPAYPSWYHSYMENGPYPPLDRIQSHTHDH